MKGKHYTVNSLPVREILTGVYRNANRNYFKISADGRTEVFAVRTQLMALGMGSTSASRILEAANIPSGSFIINKSKDKAFTTVKADVEVYSLDGETTCQEACRPIENAIAVEIGDVADESDLDDLEADELDDDLETDSPNPVTIDSSSSNQSKKARARAERAVKAAEAHAKRYELVRQGRYHGIFNKDTATTELFHTEGAALEYLHLLLHGYEGFYNSAASRNVLQPINYND
jgi:hypothetical protein